MPDNKSEARSDKLRALFGKVILGKESLTSNNAPLFIEAVCAQANRALCLQRIVASSHGYSALLSALGSDTSLAFLNGPITAFLRYLEAPQLRVLCGGSILRGLILKFVEEELVWNALVAAFASGNLDAEGEEAFSWLLRELFTLSTDKALEFAPVALDDRLRGRLLKSTSQEVRLRGRKILHIADNITAKHEYPLDGPGGRHDNDFADIRKIEILPTSDELASKDPYLPRAQETKDHESRPGGLAFHLDGQFRLLREDMLLDLREEVEVTPDVKKGRGKSLSVEHLTLAGIYCNGRSPSSLQFRCTQDLPQMPDKNDKIRLQFLRDNTKFMRHESVARIETDGKELTLGTIMREEALLAKNPPILCLQIPGKELDRVLRCLLAAESIRVVQLDTAVFAYLPILKQLQEIKDISVEDEILHWKTGEPLRPVEYSLSPDMVREICKLKLHKSTSETSSDLQDILRLTRPTKLDQAQTTCFLSALRDKVSLIQGPPGTGKSFIGSLLAKTIYRHSSERILVVCYTHHALDQFLEDLLNMGIPERDMVRLGSVNKATPRTRSLALRQATPNVRLSREESHILDMANKTASIEGARLRRAFTHLEQAQFSKEDILEHLEFRSAGLPYYSAFELSRERNGMVKTGRKWKAIDHFYLLDRWWRGKDAGTFQRNAAAFPEVWEMKPVDRIKTKKLWESEMLNDRLDALRESGTRYHDALDRISLMHMEKDLNILRRKRVIACTTTAAAKYAQRLKSVSPGVLLVEEAGEILESHILTALNPDTKHLILIGDHKQLRPKVHHDLSVEKGDGYDLNRSLFERLALQGYPHHSLHQQHRMRPELSEFVRSLAYPDLVDADTTKGRPDIRGLQKNVLFLNHNQHEVDMKHIPDWQDLTSPLSKQNPYEAKMILKCIRYLGQQDYKIDDVVVLTPYLGQLRLLMDELGKDNDPILNDLDSHDLIRAGLMPAETPKVAKPQIRISTIDNFQGEEQDLVLVSLTRSNSRHDIGFMSSAERLNVLLSRARDGLILVGDAETFMGSKKGGPLWSRLIQMLKDRNYIFDGLPVKCERHPKRLALLKNPEAFDKECPDGGCTELCDSLLNCGIHKCPRSCHHRSDHSEMQCEQIIEYKCLNGHSRKRKCCKSQSQPCWTCETEDKRRQKRLEADLKLQERRDKRKPIREAEFVDRDLKTGRIHKRDKQDEAAKDRVITVELKRQDLEVVKLYTNETLEHACLDGAINPAVGITSDKLSYTDWSTSSHQDLESKWEKSEPKREWDRPKNIEGATNNAIGDLVKVTGLDSKREKFSDHNPGFGSQMPRHLIISHYPDNDLSIIPDAVVEQMYNSRARLADVTKGLYAKILIKRLGRKQRIEGYSNALAMEYVWAHVTECQSIHLRQERWAGKSFDGFFLAQADSIRLEPMVIIKGSKHWKQLEGSMGFDSSKGAVKCLANFIQRNCQRELKELPPLAFTLHRVFLGSSGTGEMTVAKFYGPSLAIVGLLPEREVIIKHPSDLIGGALGRSEGKTKEILKASKGKVLVIDEAHKVHTADRVGGGLSVPCKLVVIDNSVAEIQNSIGEDRCVLLMGNREEMQSVTNHYNPRMARHLKYSNETESRQILKLKVKDQALKEIVFNNTAPKDALLRAERKIKKPITDVVSRIQNPAHARSKKMKDMLTELSRLSKWGHNRDIRHLLARVTSSKAFATVTAAPDASSLSVWPFVILWQLRALQQAVSGTSVS